MGYGKGGVLIGIDHREWEVADDFLDACAKVDPTKVSKIVYYEKITFVDFNIKKAFEHVSNDGESIYYTYRDEKLRNKYKAMYELEDDQDIVMDINAGQSIQIGKKFNNKLVANIYSKRKSESVKQIFQNEEYTKNGKTKARKRIVYTGEEHSDKYIYVKFANKSVLRINRERIASAKRLANNK